MLSARGTSATVGLASYPRAVVALAGARDHYQVPLALAEGNLLQQVVTDIYWPADRPWFDRTVGMMLPERFVLKRFRPELGSSRVTVSALAAAAALTTRSVHGLDLNRAKDNAVSRKARKIALQHHAALLCYSYYAAAAFQPSVDVPYRFLFQVHPHPRSLRRELLEELDLVPAARASLRAEVEVSLSPRAFERLASEPHLANGWIVASTYTARTLAEHGVPLDSIHVVPYGVDGMRFPARTQSMYRSSPYTAVYVGSMVQRKGLSYFLDAARSIGRKHVNVVLCGRGQIDRALLARYDDLEIDVRVGLSTVELVKVLHTCDVFVLPSLGEGFGHAILEAMSCGLPVIATPHTCGSDVLEDGVHGFIVPIRDARAIADTLAWGLSHRRDLADMGALAAMRARQYTWQRFRQGIRYAYAVMAESVGNPNG